MVSKDFDFVKQSTKICENNKLSEEQKQSLQQHIIICELDLIRLEIKQIKEGDYGK